MTDLGTGELGALDGLADLSDVVDDGVGIGANVGARGDTLGAVAVEVLAANRDTINEGSEVIAVLVDGALQSRELIREAGARGPQSKKQRRLCLDGGGDGRDRVIF